MRGDVVADLFRSFKRRGPLEILRLVWKNIVYHVRRYFDSRFDRRFGIETVEKVDLDRLRIDSRNKRHGVLYEPTPIRTFRSIIKSLRIPEHDYVFVDYGSGKGRIVIAALEAGFKRVIGVEFAPELCEITKCNVAAYKCKRGFEVNTEIHCTDAVEFDIPAVPCVLYFFNPFERKVLEEVVRNIRHSYESTPRKIYVVHYNPVNTDLFACLDFMKKMNTRSTVLELAGPSGRRFACYESR